MANPVRDSFFSKFFGCVFPGEEELAHQANEYITLDSMMKNVRIIAHAIEKLAGE